MVGRRKKKKRSEQQLKGNIKKKKNRKKIKTTKHKHTSEDLRGSTKTIGIRTQL